MIASSEYGKWPTPITAEKIAQGSGNIVSLVTEGNSTYLCELRPENQGRYTVMRLEEGGILSDLTPPDFNVRTKVHEYGRGAFTVSRGVVYASNGADGALYKIEKGKAPERITEGNVRFADLQMTKQGLLAVGESHTPGKEAENFLALIDVNTGEWKKIASGYDFYSFPRMSPDGKKIAWICWKHPHMPWEASELWCAEWGAGGELVRPHLVSGGENEAVFQPEWSPDGLLYFVSDKKSGWWNLHRMGEGGVENVCPMEAEVALPQWIFGLSTYAFLDREHVAFTYNSKGYWHLAVLDLATKKMEEVSVEGCFFHQLRSGTQGVSFLAQYPGKQETVMQLGKAPGYPVKMLKQQAEKVSPKYVSLPQHIAFPSHGRVAYGFFFPPHNEEVTAPPGTKPPLVVMLHGGPTAQAHGTFEMEINFWTSRGFAVLDVNYGGSTGYGRPFRSLLDHAWGVVDVEDCVSGALYLCEQGLVDREKLAIRGGSAGGFTTLAALAFKKVFKAGASYYGVADLTALAHDTHKFESRYLDGLVGKYPEEKAIWEERSPLHAADHIEAPLILFQGEEDRVVPKNQSIAIYEALVKRGVPVELHLYPGEEHGFRRAEHIADSLNREVAFYLKAFGRGI